MNHFVPGYPARELTRRDKFFHAYVGKDYGLVGASEALTMGVEQLMTDAGMIRLLAADSEHFGLILSILTGRVRP